MLFRSLREIITHIEDNQLVVKVKNGVVLGSHEPIVVYISAPDVAELEVSGSGDLYCDSPWNLDELSTTVSGSGSINISSLNARHLTSSISGSGSITASSGSVTNEDLNISGSGTIDAEDPWGKRKLAYEIDKRTEGDYYVYQFHAPVETIAELDRVLHITDPVIRYMIVRRDDLN